MHTPGEGTSLVERLVAALRLDLRLYQQVCLDRTANGQALTVVLLTGLCNGIGLVRRLGDTGIASGVVAGVLGWFLWAAVILLIATLFRHHRDRRSLLRALAFADAPGVFLIIGGVPFIGSVVRILVVLWLVAASVRAVQAVFAVSQRRAVVISVVGFIVYLVFGVVSSHALAR
jgi:hypothetical protein